MQLLHTAHVPPGDGPFPTVIALHGWGASAHDLFGLAPLFPGGTMVLCPQGKVELPIGPGMAGYGWFPLEPGTPPDPRAFLEASRQIRTFVDGAVERYPVDRDRLVVLGFSQGGLMAYDLALRDPDRFAGVAALSTWLPAPVAANLPEKPAHRGFPVLVIHGTRDELVPVDRARESREVLEGMGVDLDYHEFEMGHEIGREALRVIVRWLGDRVR